MKRQDYIKEVAIRLKQKCDRREKISLRYTSGNLTQKSTQNLNADLNFLGMEIEKEKERLAFALDLLLPENARSEYRPSQFHVYQGIRFELEKLKFDQ